MAMQCLFCGELHFSASCEKVKDTEERKKILLRDRRCFLCMKVGHRDNVENVEQPTTTQYVPKNKEQETVTN